MFPKIPPENYLNFFGFFCGYDELKILTIAGLLQYRDI